MVAKWAASGHFDVVCWLPTTLLNKEQNIDWLHGLVSNRLVGETEIVVLAEASKAETSDWGAHLVCLRVSDFSENLLERWLEDPKSGQYHLSMMMLIDKEPSSH